MREITKYHDTSKTVKERAKNKLFGAVYSHTAIILLLILLQIGIMVLTFTSVSYTHLRAPRDTR